MKDRNYQLILLWIIVGLLLSCSSSGKPLSDDLPVINGKEDNEGEKPDDKFPPSGMAQFGEFKYVAANEWKGDYNPKTQYLNPILPGCYPDPSICRAGKDYYLVNSTFGYYPGVPIWHSTDLVHWEQLGYVLNRPSQLMLKSGRMSWGVYAPDIKYNPHNRTFYMITTGTGYGSTTYVKTDDPKKCNWSAPVALPSVGGIDPSFFFDEDGKAYILNNDAPAYEPLYSGHRAIWIREFDWKNDRVVGEAKVVIDGGLDISKKPSWIEGPHLYKVKGKYYLMAAEGGTGPNHREVVLSSDSPMGPFKPCTINPILTQMGLPSDRSNPITCAGHADLVETENGEWFAVFLAVRPIQNGHENTGRETFLLPVKWNDEQPVILEKGTAVPYVVDMTPEMRRLSEANTIKGYEPYAPALLWTSEGLSKDATFIRTPVEDFFMIEKNGQLRLKPKNVGIDQFGNPSFIGRRVNSKKFYIQTTLAYTPKSGQDFAGVVCFQNDYCYIQFGKTMNGNGEEVLQLKSFSSKEKKELKDEYEYLLSDKEKKRKVYLKVEALTPEEYTFSYAFAAPDSWTVLGKVKSSLLSTATAGGFTGTTIGIYATTGAGI